MIKLLSSWEDLGQSILSLQRLQSFHSDPLKNWDLAQIGELLEPVPKSARILDAGCSASQCSLLRFLARKGYTDLVGIDLHISVDDRIQQALLMKDRRTLKPPFSLVRGDITRTGLGDETFDAIFSLSVIEHGVDLGSLLREMRRLLRPGGILYLSTDYWPEKIPTDGIRHWGLPWTIFSRDEIVALVQKAVDMGFVIDRRDIPPAGDPVVRWSGKAYTFISMALTKGPGSA